MLNRIKVRFSNNIVKMEIMQTDPQLQGRPRSYDDSLDRINSSGRTSEDDCTANPARPVSFTGSIQCSMTESERIDVCDSTALLQAVVFVEDAVKYRSINHKTDSASLWYYRVYYSWLVQWTLYLAITTILTVAFFEYPSSLTTGNTADPRYRGERRNPPCGVTEAIEFTCLLIFTADLVMKVYLIGTKQFIKSPWLIAYVLVIVASLADWIVTINGSCGKIIRFRRMLRPFFLLQNSTLMKKTVRSICRTLPKVASVLLLLLIHLYFFTMVGMLIFPQPQHRLQPDIPGSTVVPTTVKGEVTNHPGPDPYLESQKFFKDILTGFMSMLVLLTTANHPDVAMPAYMLNRFYCLYFIVFLVIGLYFFFNMLTAVIYNEFRGYLLRSIQSSFLRRRLGFQAAFEMLRRQGRLTLNTAGVSMATTLSVSVVKAVILQTDIKKSAKHAIVAELDENMGGSLTSTDFQQLFDVLDRDTGQRRKPPIVTKNDRILRKIQYCVTHQFFNYFGALVAMCNVIVISLEVQFQYDSSFYARDNVLARVNFSFILFYLFEQILKVWAYGCRRYVASKLNIFDGLLTIILVFVEILYAVVNGNLFNPQGNKNALSEAIPLYDLVRVINILIIFRLFRLITHFKTMSVIAATLFGLIRNLWSFIGILVVIYYIFAMLGMELFSGVIKVPQPNDSFNSTEVECGSYSQLEYWANNFDDFAAALVVLFDIMVVNNWHVFLKEYANVTSRWSHLFFIAWYFVSVLVCLNVFTALILENFITKWDREQQQQASGDPNRQPSYQMSVHNMFRDALIEPTEEELMLALRNHPHMKHLHL
ncbi:two pore calcium channel protein 2-like isoform X2 [Acanthaster planci]|uniref:Two pore calcium channel protein 2-like isoform X2 n=1 Tax=Acanthaster planci TaxID=133434 RepID=A0A8B8A4G4_ACAPL|nr:two pore calcium channel protein 2-like isoform X2 [Acanthaster planci]